jgi:hypothetical protein
MFCVIRLFAACIFLIVGGCASVQLGYNTLDVGGSVNSLYINQTLENLSRTIDDHFAIPSQIDLAAGTVQTSNSIAPQVSFPLSNTVTRNGANVVTSIVRASTNMNVNASDAWQQSWTIAPIIDGDSLRNLRALYRNVVTPEADLRREYVPARIKSGQTYVYDPYALAEPHCVLCGPHLVPNRKLVRGWLYWSSDIGSPTPERLPPPGVSTVRLGRYGTHELLMTQMDYDAGYLQDFVLFVMGASGDTGASSGGDKGGAKGGGGKRFNVIIPQQINPQIQ